MILSGSLKSDGGPSLPPRRVVIMGVAGCGKSSLGRTLSRLSNWPMIEGDDFHSDQNIARMRAGIPLTDADREAWLRSLGAELQSRKHGAVLACSALKKAYRDLLRSVSPGLRFVYLQITEDEALRRLRDRTDHFFPPELLKSQFQTLEQPLHEPLVLQLDAQLPLEELTARTMAWLKKESGRI